MKLTIEIQRHQSGDSFHLSGVNVQGWTYTVFTESADEAVSALRVLLPQLEELWQQSEKYDTGAKEEGVESFDPDGPATNIAITLSVGEVFAMKLMQLLAGEPFRTNLTKLRAGAN